MRPNLFLTIISLLLTALVSYLAYSVAEGKENDIVCGVGSAVCFVATLLPMIGLKYDSARVGANIRILSGVFFLVFLASHACFIHLGIRMPYYVIANGILLVIFLAIFYKLSGGQGNEE